MKNKIYLNGKFINPKIKKFINKINQFSNKKINSYAISSKYEINLSIQHLITAQNKWQLTSINDKSELLNIVSSDILKQSKKLAKITEIVLKNMLM